MGNKMRNKILVLIAIMVLVALLTGTLIACTPNKTPSNKQPTDSTDTPSTNEWGTPGYTQSTITEKDMLTDLVKSVSNIISQASRNAITKDNPEFSLEFKLNVNINGRDEKFRFIVNYDLNNPDDFVMTGKRTVGDAEENAFSVSYFADEANEGNAAKVYITISDNKLVVPLNYSSLNTFLPIKLGSEFNEGIESIISFASGCVYLENNGKIDYEYKKVAGKVDRHYRLKIDLRESLAKAYSALLLMSNVEDTKETIQFMIGSLFGVDTTSSETIRETMPNTQLSIEFSTTGGNTATFGGASVSLSSFDTKLVIENYEDSEEKGIKNNVTKISLEDIKVMRKLSEDVPSEDSLKGYIDYNNGAIKVKGQMVYADAPEEIYDINVSFLYTGQADQGADDLLSFTISSQEDGREILSLYYIKNMMYLNTAPSNSIAVPFDFDMFFDKVQDKVYAGDASPLELVCYFVGSLHINDESVMSYDFNAEFFSKMLNITLDELIEIMEACYRSQQGTGLLVDILESNDIDLSKLIIEREFTIFIDTDENFVEVKETVTDVPESEEDRKQLSNGIK